MSIYDDELPVDDATPDAPAPMASGLDAILSQMPAPVPQGPPAPIMAPQIAHQPASRAMALAALAAAIAGGPRSGLGGLAGGVMRGQQMAQAEADHRAQMEAQQQARQQSYQLAQDHADQQRNAVRTRAIESVRKELPNFETKEDYDKYVDFAGNGLLASGFRDLGPNNLRVMFPFTAPSAEKKAGKVLDAWFKNPANAAALKKDPSLAFKASVQVDLNGDGVPENVPLTKVGELAGRPFAAGPDGQPIQLQADGPDPLKGSAFEVALRNQAAQFKATNGRDPSPQELQPLIEKAKNVGKDPEMADIAKESARTREAINRLMLGMAPTQEDADALADDIGNNRMAPSQLNQVVQSRGQFGGALKTMAMRSLRKRYPDYNLEEGEGTYQLAKSPGFQQTVRYMDSVQESLPRLQQTANVLGNGNVRFINGIRNMTGAQLNNPTLKKFQTDVLFLSDEVAKILQGGGTGSGTSDAKLRQAAEILSASDSPQSIAAALGEIKALLGFRRKALTRGTYMESREDPSLASAKKKLGVGGK